MFDQFNAIISTYSHLICHQHPRVTVMTVIIDTLIAFVSSTSVTEKRFLVQHISITEKQMRNCGSRKRTIACKQQHAKKMERSLKSHKIIWIHQVGAHLYAFHLVPEFLVNGVNTCTAYNVCVENLI